MIDKRREEFLMKQKNFTEEQIALAFHQAERTSAEEVIRHLGISLVTFYRWKIKYGGLLPSEGRFLTSITEM